MRKYVLSLLIGGICTNGAFATGLTDAILNVQNACSGISESMYNLKVKAGIGTAVSAVGTVAGGVALGAGIAKQKTDSEIAELPDEIYELAKKRVQQDGIGGVDVEVLHKEIDDYFASLPDEEVVNDVSLENLVNKSKKQGNLRTGFAGVATATNIASTALAATNKVGADLEQNISNCIEAVSELAKAKIVASLEETDTDADLARAESIIVACRDYEIVDLKPINSRAVGAAVASGIGAGTGVVGTITSALANTDKTRAGDATTEHTLNAAANVMSGATAAAGATAAIFNATQIAAIKKVVSVADMCEEALK